MLYTIRKLQKEIGKYFRSLQVTFSYMSYIHAIATLTLPKIPQA